MPTAGQRAAGALRHDPKRSNRLVAIEASCDARTVRAVRKRLEASGQIPPTPSRTQRQPPPRKPGRTRLAMMAGAVTTREIRAIAGVSRSAIWWARHHPPPMPALRGRACGPVVHRPSDPEFPVGWPRETPAALRICGTYCPVRAECAQWALTLPGDDPRVLGAMTQGQRIARKAARR